MSVNKTDYKKAVDNLLKPKIKQPKTKLGAKIRMFLRAYFQYISMRIRYRKEINRRIKTYRYLRQGATVLRWMNDQFPNRSGKKQFIRDACKFGFVHSRWIDFYENKIDDYEKYLRALKKKKRTIEGRRIKPERMDYLEKGAKIGKSKETPKGQKPSKLKAPKA